MCGHVFTLLDHATDEIEATEIRNRIEAERAERERETLGDVTGVYYKPPKEETFEEESAEKAEEEAAVFLHPEGDLKEGEAGSEQIEKEEMDASQEEVLGEIEREFTVGRDDLTEWEEEIVNEERSGEGVEEKPETEATKEEESIETVLETTGYGEIEQEGEFDIEETGGTGEVAEWPPPGDVLEEGLEESSFEEENVEEKEVEETYGPESSGLEEDLSAEESLGTLYEKKKRRSLLPLLVIILVILILGGSGWYLYKSGMSGSLVQAVTEKIEAIRGKSQLMLSDLKNEQEPAIDGKFFVVRGFVHNKRETPFPYVALRIKIYDNKNNVILTKQTVAGRILKADEISKMTVHDAVKQYSAIIEMNKKSSGKLGPNQKLPFLFLFDLSKFPRDKAKTFQVEIIKPPK